MPPKGWKKYPEGFKPVNSSGAPLREKEQYGIEDLLLPRATMLKLAKDVLPDGSQIPKDGLMALLRSSTMFINYLAAEANNIAHIANRKTIVPTDVFKALENTNFASFVPEVRQSLEAYERVTKERAANKVLSKASDTVEDQNVDGFMLNDEEEDEYTNGSKIDQTEPEDDLNEPEETVSGNIMSDTHLSGNEKSSEANVKRTKILSNSNIDLESDAAIKILSTSHTPQSI
ncbi:histone-fold-containing protein [Nadsonia fulvescens var. elongata DSM 6958]|uniref:DNA polymerase epsilon subunit D n=1 Tax=Nadsonia fulvescens var. elongata DSM 6958 TaxID=857566 RepID=A0A1E3PTD1_9ASCO|nr:histone-fold-containing protein [Nadsonia fulvescens var. elongata DSM 6958]